MGIRHRYWIAGVAPLAGVLAMTACKSSDSGGNGGNGQESPKQGQIFLSTIKAGAGSTGPGGYEVTAAFTDSTGLPVTENCSNSQIGSCKVANCTVVLPDGGQSLDAGTVKSVSAGKISITGGKEQVDLTVGAGGTYPGVNSASSALWSGGEILTVTAAGDTNGISAFTDTVTAPAFVSLTTPKLDATTQGVSQNRAQDLNVAWSADDNAPGNVQVEIATLDAQTKFITAQCTFSASAKQGTVPAGVLGQFDLGTVNLTVNGYVESTKQLGDWQINTIAATSTAASGGRITLE